MVYIRFVSLKQKTLNGKCILYPVLFISTFYVWFVLFCKILFYLIYLFRASEKASCWIRVSLRYLLRICSVWACPQHQTRRPVLNWMISASEREVQHCCWPQSTNQKTLLGHVTSHWPIREQNCSTGVSCKIRIYLQKLSSLSDSSILALFFSSIFDLEFKIQEFNALQFVIMRMEMLILACLKQHGLHTKCQD